MKTNEQIILSLDPNLNSEEIADIIQEWELSERTMCSNCESPLSESDLEYTGRSWGDGYNEPYEYEFCCPHCRAIEPELIKMDLELYLSLI